MVDLMDKAMGIAATALGAVVAGSTAWARSVERRLTDTQTKQVIADQVVERIHAELKSLNAKQDTQNDQLQQIIGYLKRR